MCNSIKKLNCAGINNANQILILTKSTISKMFLVLQTQMIFSTQISNEQFEINLQLIPL